MSSRQILMTVGEIEPGTTIEAELVRAGQSGDAAALDQLLRLHKRAVFTLCFGILGQTEDAEDAVQETFLRALRALPGFRPGRATFRTWLFRIAVNVSLNWKRDRRAADPWNEDHPATASSTASAEAIALHRLQVREALAELPPRHRALIHLKLVEGWSVAEIAAAMGWSPIRVKNELAKARRTLAEWQLRNAVEGEEP